MSLVVDSSIALAWCFDEEQTAEVMVVLHRAVNHGAVAPVHWPLEVANGLRSAVRRKRITTQYRSQTLEKLARIGVRLDRHTDDHAWSGTLRISDETDLTVYDAAYLEVALRLKLPLATLDNALAHAARSENVVVLGSPAVIG